MQFRVFIGLGGNLGVPHNSLSQALLKLKTLKQGSYFKCSRFYESSPVSSLAQPHYLNAVCSFEVSYHPEELLDVLENIEKELGKVPKAKEEPRLIDLDILFYGEQCYKSERLTIPHPKWQERLFVLAPLADLAETLWVPEDGKLLLKNIKDMLHSFSDRTQRVDVKYEP